MLTRRGLIRAGMALAALPLVGCAQQSPRFAQRTLFNFNTVCVLGGAMANSVLEEAQELCERCEQLFSRTISTSDVARINAAAGVPVEVDALTAELIAASLGYCEASGGLFDITIGTVSELWDFTEGVVPAPDALSEALPHVGWEHVHVEGTRVQLDDPHTHLDLGGIAKGFVTDKLMELFMRHEVQDAFVNLGGNVAVLGHNEQGKAWSVGVRDPFGTSDADVVAKVSTTSGSLVTSGLYERSFEQDGRRYWHILDPRTGYPVETSLASASLLCKKSIDGDGYTKPLFMLELDEALAFVQNKRDVQALLIDQDATFHTTPGASFEAL